MKRVLIAVCVGLLLATYAGAKDKPKAQGAAQKSLDFDGDVVEGMNRQPLDSLTSLSEGTGDRSKNHLYKRRKKFKPENRELAREVLETF